MKVDSLSTRPSDGWEIVPPEYYPTHVRETRSRIRFDILERKASALRNGMVCSIDRNRYEFGGFNIIFEVLFEDMTTWIVRLRAIYEGITDQRSHDQAMESEVVTLNYVKRNTTKIPVPQVYGYDSSFTNEVGTAFMFMEAMNGKRLVGGGLKDFIPDEHKPKVYKQVTDFMLELSSLPFSMIGMLGINADGKEQVGPIVHYHTNTQHGPYTTSIEFYWHRAKILLNSDDSCLKGGDSGKDFTTISIDRLRLLAVPFLVDEKHNHGPFILTHPDFGLSNMLFDDEFNITALLDWSGAQTSPLESFARPPHTMIPQPIKARPLTESEISRREMFFRIFRSQEVGDPLLYSPTISEVQTSLRCAISGFLDDEAIGGHNLESRRPDLLEFVFGRGGQFR
jgi:aminoglycoside phosphotransferase (APT) family kinase protein